MKLCLAVLLIASISAPPANALTCAAFRSKLDGAIIAGGRRVAFPRFKVIPGAATQPDEGTIVGLDVLLTCSDSDTLQSVDITGSIDSEDDEENLQRHIRFDALAGATICILEPKAAKACFAEAEAAQASAIRKFLAAKARGEPDPSGFDIVILQKLGVDPIVKATPGKIAFTADLTEQK